MDLLMTSKALYNLPLVKLEIEKVYQNLNDGLFNILPKPYLDWAF